MPLFSISTAVSSVVVIRPSDALIRRLSRPKKPVPPVETTLMSVKFTSPVLLRTSMPAPPPGLPVASTTTASPNATVPLLPSTEMAALPDVSSLFTCVSRRGVPEPNSTEPLLPVTSTPSASRLVIRVSPRNSTSPLFEATATDARSVPFTVVTPSVRTTLSAALPEIRMPLPSVRCGAPAVIAVAVTSIVSENSTDPPARLFAIRIPASAPAPRWSVRVTAFENRTAPEEFVISTPPALRSVMSTGALNVAEPVRPSIRMLCCEAASTVRAATCGLVLINE